MNRTTPLDVHSVATRSVVEAAPHVTASYVAIVHTPGAVRFGAAASTRAELVRRLADYVRPRVNHALWPDDARHVRSLLVRGELEAAVEVYFGRVGERWDGEWLVTTALATSKGRGDPTVDTQCTPLESRSILGA